MLHETRRLQNLHSEYTGLCRSITSSAFSQHVDPVLDSGPHNTPGSRQSLRYRGREEFVVQLSSALVCNADELAPILHQMDPTHPSLEKMLNEIDLPSIEVNGISKGTGGEVVTSTGSFPSPLARYLPPESSHCIFQVVRPPKGVPVRAACVMMPATGDQGFSLRRKLYADALAKSGVIGILVIAPYYGRRKASKQTKHYIRTASEVLIQSYAITCEAVLLLHWARQAFDCKLAITGISWGGAMTATSSTMYPGPLAVIPYMGCPTPGPAFAYGPRFKTRQLVYYAGVMSGSVDWQALKDMPKDLPGVSVYDGDAVTCFVEYTEHITDFVRWKELFQGRGARIVRQIQCTSDAFVSFQSGQALFRELTLDCPKSAELRPLVGGHVSGFVLAPWVLPPAVLQALECLEDGTIAGNTT